MQAKRYRHQALKRGFVDGQREGKNSAAARLVARGNAPVMVLDDLLANRESQTCAVRLAKRRERVKQPVGDLRGNARAGVFDFGDDLAALEFEAHRKCVRRWAWHRWHCG